MQFVLRTGAKAVDNNVKERLMRRNRELIDILLEKIRTEYREDIDLVGVCGSFFTGDFHENSDLDLLVVVNNDQGYGFSRCFILDGVGFDFYGSSWSKLERMASYDHTFLSHLVDVNIVYVRNTACKERFLKLRQQALQMLDEPVTLRIVSKGAKQLDQAALAYGNLMLADEIGAARQNAGLLVRHVSDTVCILNHNYFRLGVKHLLREILAMRRVPENFMDGFNGVVAATSVPQLKEAATKLIKSVKKMFDEIKEETLKNVVPTSEALKGTYEEIWSNWRNKIRYAAEHNDALLALSAGVSCQEFYDEMHAEHGSVPINLMKHFQPHDLHSFAHTFEQAMRLYRQEYERLNMEPLVYDSIDSFRMDYLDQLRQ